MAGDAGGQRELELPAVLGLALVLELGWIAVHLARGVDADYESARGAQPVVALRRGRARARRGEVSPLETT